MKGIIFIHLVHLSLVFGLLPSPPLRSFREPHHQKGRYFNKESDDRLLSVELPGGVRAGCQGISDYPGNWPNANYYKRFCYSGTGLPIITDGIAIDSALERTAWTIDNMLATVHPQVIQKMKDVFFRQAVMGRYPYELCYNLPEYTWLDPSFWATRRGLGGTDNIPVGANAEEDVLCYGDELYHDQDITVHEFGHSLHLLGFNHLWPEFQTELNAAYANARANSLWGWGYVGSYAMTNDQEYFAMGLQSYFDVQYPYDEQGAPWNRNLLFQKDPTLANLIDRYMGFNPWRGSCP